MTCHIGRFSMVTMFLYDMSYRKIANVKIKLNMSYITCHIGCFVRSESFYMTCHIGTLILLYDMSYRTIYSPICNII